MTFTYHFLGLRCHCGGEQLEADLEGSLSGYAHFCAVPCLTASCAHPHLLRLRRLGFRCLGHFEYGNNIRHSNSRESDGRPRWPEGGGRWRRARRVSCCWILGEAPGGFQRDGGGPTGWDVLMVRAFNRRLPWAVGVRLMSSTLSRSNCSCFTHLRTPTCSQAGSCSPTHRHQLMCAYMLVRCCGSQAGTSCVAIVGPNCVLQGLVVGQVGQGERLQFARHWRMAAKVSQRQLRLTPAPPQLSRSLDLKCGLWLVEQLRQLCTQPTHHADAPYQATPRTRHLILTTSHHQPLHIAHVLVRSSNR
jgi:hypothetical protein